MPEIVQVPNTGTRRNIFPKYQIELGPWTRGMDSSNDPALLGPNVLSECTNFIINSDGRLRSRPPVKRQYPDSTFFSVDPTVTYIRGLGSVKISTDNVVPIIAKWDNSVALGGDGKITFWRYSTDGSGAIPAVPQWNETYAEIDYPYTTDSIWLIPIQAIVYDTKHFVFFNRIGGQVSIGVTNPLGTTPLMGPSRLYDAGGNPPDKTFIRKVLIFKDRFILHTDQDLYWSSENPTGITDDWSEVAPNTAGNLGYNRELTHNRIHDIIVYQNEIYILGSDSVSKLSWNTDPAVDGVFTVVSSQLGGQTFALADGNLYVFNGFGLYRLVTNYFVEVSAPVRDFMRASCKGKPEGLDTLDGEIEDYDERPVVGMYRIDNLILIGPLNADAPLRANDTADDFSCNVYLIYNVDTDIWFKWQFNPNQTDFFPIAGPSQNDVMTMAINDPAFADRYVWVGRHLVDGTKPGTPAVYGQGVYSMEAAANLISDTAIPVGYDDAGPSTFGGTDNRLKPIGLKFTTAQIDLGQGDLWKRLQTSLLDARAFTDPALIDGSIKMGYVLDDPTNAESDANRIVNLNPVTIDRLAFGGAYRCRRFGFYYDSLTGIDATADNDSDLDLVKKVAMYITLSSKDIVGRAR